MTQLYEVVSGLILLHKREIFYRLHGEVLLPLMKQVGIVPVLMIITEVGRYNTFLDVYRYRDFADYQQKTDALLSSPGMEPYYKNIGDCIHGGIEVQLMRDLPYAMDHV